MVTGQARFKRIENRHIAQREENQHEFLRKACEMGYILWWPSLKYAIFHTNHTGLGKTLSLGEIGWGTIARITCQRAGRAEENQDSKQFLLTVNKCLLGTSHVPEIGDTTVSKKQGHGLLIVYSLMGTWWTTAQINTVSVELGKKTDSIRVYVSILVKELSDGLSGVGRHLSGRSEAW